MPHAIFTAPLYYRLAHIAVLLCSITCIQAEDSEGWKQFKTQHPHASLALYCAFSSGLAYGLGKAKPCLDSLTPFDIPPALQMDSNDAEEARLYAQLQEANKGFNFGKNILASWIAHSALDHQYGKIHPHAPAQKIINKDHPEFMKKAIEECYTYFLYGAAVSIAHQGADRMSQNFTQDARLIGPSMVNGVSNGVIRVLEEHSDKLQLPVISTLQNWYPSSYILYPVGWATRSIASYANIPMISSHVAMYATNTLLEKYSPTPSS